MKSKMALPNIAEVWNLYIKIRSIGANEKKIYYAILWKEENWKFPRGPHDEAERKANFKVELPG